MTDPITANTRLTVGEFIKHLKTLPQDLPILAEYEGWECGELNTATAIVEEVVPSNADRLHYANGDLVRKKGLNHNRNGGGFFPAVVITC